MNLLKSTQLIDNKNIKKINNIFSRHRTFIICRKRKRRKAIAHAGVCRQHQLAAVARSRARTMAGTGAHAFP